jgi:CBS domain-containing protein
LVYVYACARQIIVIRLEVDMTVVDIMSKEVACVTADDFVTHARQIMRDRHLRSLPVVEDERFKRVLGILTDQDVMHISSARSGVTVRGFVTISPAITPDTDVEEACVAMVGARLSRVPVIRSIDDQTLVGILSTTDLLKKLHPRAHQVVRDIMTEKVVTCLPEDRIAKVWSTMLESDYTGLPVISPKKVLIGMVTRYDIIKAGFARIGLEDEGGTRAKQSQPVEKIMNTPAYTVSPATPVSEAIDMMLKLDVGRLSVVDEGRLAGIVDRIDAVQACLP